MPKQTQLREIGKNSETNWMEKAERRKERERMAKLQIQCFLFFLSIWPNEQTDTRVSTILYLSEWKFIPKKEDSYAFI